MVPDWILMVSLMFLMVSLMFLMVFLMVTDDVLDIPDGS